MVSAQLDESANAPCTSTAVAASAPAFGMPALACTVVDATAGPLVTAAQPMRASAATAVAARANLGCCRVFMIGWFLSWVTGLSVMRNSEWEGWRPRRAPPRVRRVERVRLGAGEGRTRGACRAAPRTTKGGAAVGPPRGCAESSGCVSVRVRAVRDARRAERLVLRRGECAWQADDA